MPSSTARPRTGSSSHKTWGRKLSTPASLRTPTAVHPHVVLPPVLRMPTDVQASTVPLFALLRTFAGVRAVVPHLDGVDVRCWLSLCPLSFTRPRIVFDHLVCLSLLDVPRLLPTPADARSVARFLRECQGLAKDIIGTYISEPPTKKYEVHPAVHAHTAPRCCIEAVCNLVAFAIDGRCALSLYTRDYLCSSTPRCARRSCSCLTSLA